jgi:lipopolysaccharide export system protein LptA
MPQMARESREIRKGRAIRRLRWVLLGAAVLAVATVVALLVASRSGRPAASQEEDDETSFEPSGELVTVGEGFERTFSEGDRPLFTVRGDRYSVDREGIVYLDGVEVTIYQEDGSRYVIEGAKGRFDIERREGRLGGGVRLSTPAGVSATMRQLHVRDQGASLASQGQVVLTLGDAYEGRADKLWIVPDRRLVHLRDEVEIRGLAGKAEGFRLRARDVLLDPRQESFRADGDAVLSRRGEVIRARRISAFFDVETHEVQSLRARWDVSARFDRQGTLAEIGGSEVLEENNGNEAGQVPSRVLIECEDLVMILDPEKREAREVNIEGGPRGVARLTSVEEGTGTRRLLEAVRITAALEGGQPVQVEAEERVLLAILAKPPEGAEGDEGGGSTIPSAARRATGDRAVADFGREGVMSSVELTGDVVVADGTLEATGGKGVYDVLLERAELSGGVVLTDGGSRASGERGVFDLREGRAELFGRPAVAETEAVRMEAPRLIYARADGLVHGTGGVRARLDEADDSVLGGSPIARGDGPVWVEAEEGFFREQPRGFLFKGRVRAWRGDDLLVADELRGDETEDLVVATGDVRTLWVPEGDAGEEQSPSADGAEPAGRAPLEVRSTKLVYRKALGLLVYTGGVVVSQESRTLACRDMDVDLSEGGGVEELRCSGDARVEDPAEGRTLLGDFLRYRPGSRVVEVTAAEGAKVSMRDRDGNVLEGARMTYDVDSGRVQVFGRAGEAAPEAAAESGGGEGR